MASSKMAKKVKLQTRRKKPFIRLLSNAHGQKYCMKPPVDEIKQSRLGPLSTRKTQLWTDFETACPQAHLLSQPQSTFTESGRNLLHCSQATLVCVWESTMVFYCIGGSERRPNSIFWWAFFSLLRLQEAEFDLQNPEGVKQVMQPQAASIN